MPGAINSQNDVDWYKFEATKDYFEVGFSINDAYLGTETTGGWDVEIFDSNSDNIISYSNIKKIPHINSLSVAPYTSK